MYYEFSSCVAFHFYDGVFRRAEVLIFDEGQFILFIFLIVLAWFFLVGWLVFIFSIGSVVLFFSISRSSLYIRVSLWSVI